MRAFWTLAMCAGVGLIVQTAPRAQSDGGSGVDAQEPAIVVPGVEGDYLRAMHVRIHWRWVHNFIEGVAMSRPPQDRLNDPALTAEVLFTVRWDGSAAEVTLSKSSGNKVFDAAALAAARGDIKYPVPPLALFGDDGVAHFRWTFARDRRLCSDAEIRRREDPLEEALPRLFIQGRVKEALLRVARYMREGDPNAMSVFARTWLARPLTDRVADASAASALARLGDRRQLERLRPALARADTALVAARGLAALKVDLCAQLEPALTAPDPAASELAQVVLRASGFTPPEGSPCLRTLAAIAEDEAAPKAARAAALQTWAQLSPAAARHTVINLLQDPSPALRAAAALAFARPGGGRPTLYRLEPMLKDASSEVRAAAAAGLVRACGELSFDYLQPLFKSNDPQPLLAMTPGLGALKSQASLDLLAKVLKKGRPDLQQAVMRALAQRTDAAGRALFKPMAEATKKDSRASSELRLLAYTGATPEELAPLARDPRLGVLSFKSLLLAKRHKEAADWLVSSFDRLSPEVLVEAFSAWLANPPPPIAASQ